jgi:hypothetical protein
MVYNFFYLPSNSVTIKYLHSVFSRLSDATLLLMYPEYSIPCSQKPAIGDHLNPEELTFSYHSYLI